MSDDQDKLFIRSGEEYIALTRAQVEEVASHLAAGKSIDEITISLLNKKVKTAEYEAKAASLPVYTIKFVISNADHIKAARFAATSYGKLSKLLGFEITSLNLHDDEVFYPHLGVIHAKFLCQTPDDWNSSTTHLLQMITDAVITPATQWFWVVKADVRMSPYVSEQLSKRMQERMSSYLDVLYRCNLPEAREMYERLKGEWHWDIVEEKENENDGQQNL